MKTNFLRIYLFALSLTTGLFACKNETNPIITVCRLTSTTDQLVETSGKLTDEMLRTFAYNGNTLTTITEKSTSQQATFTLSYTDNRVSGASTGQDVISLLYTSATTPPVSATFSRTGKVQSTFAMEYNTSGRMTKITENRQLLPANSLTVQRVYTFTYDNTGNLTLERARFTLNDGTIVEQETEYTFDQKPSPYAYVAELPVLTLIALSQAVDTKPGRFWQSNTPISLKTYNLTSTGSRANLRESSTFAPVYDVSNKPMTQEQSALLYQTSLPDPVTKKNRQTFGYLCL